MINPKWIGTHDNISGEILFNHDGTCAGCVSQKKFGLRQQASFTGLWSEENQLVTLYCIKTDNLLARKFVPASITLRQEPPHLVLPWKDKCVHLSPV